MGTTDLIKLCLKEITEHSLLKDFVMPLVIPSHPLCLKKYQRG